MLLEPGSTTRASSGPAKGVISIVSVSIPVQSVHARLIARLGRSQACVLTRAHRVVASYSTLRLQYRKLLAVGSGEVEGHETHQVDRTSRSVRGARTVSAACGSANHG